MSGEESTGECFGRATDGYIGRRRASEDVFLDELEGE